MFPHPLSLGKQGTEQEPRTPTPSKARPEIQARGHASESFLVGSVAQQALLGPLLCASLCARGTAVTDLLSGAQWMVSSSRWNGAGFLEEATGRTFQEREQNAQKPPGRNGCSRLEETGAWDQDASPQAMGDHVDFQQLRRRSLPSEQGSRVTIFVSLGALA